MQRLSRSLSTLTALGLIVSVAPTSAEEVRIVSWNVTFYESGRVSDFQTAIYSSFNGRSMSPDVFIGQEFVSALGVANFLNILNGAPGSPGDWAAAPFIDGPDTDSALFYRTSLFELATDLSPTGVTVVATGSSDPDNHPRHIMRYDLRLVGFASPEATIAMYSTHMKAGASGGDAARRLVEAERIRDDAENLPAGWHFLLGGDFNIQNSSENAYQELVGIQVNNDGRFFDPINTPGDWNNNSSYRFVHTQDQQGQMDDRFDQILLSQSLLDDAGFDYIGNWPVPYSTSTWNDLNHSYRSWGNDGTSYNQPLTVVGNQMVGPTIAQALIDSALNGGHLPVFLDLVLPANQAGACCLPCICNDEISEADCISQGGTFRGVGTVCETLDPPCFDDTMRINEVLIRHDGTQTMEFVELFGEPNDLICGLSVAVVEGETLSKGQVKRLVSFGDCGGSPCALDENGYFLIGGTDVSPDILVGGGTNIFEDGTETIVLLRDTQLQANPQLPNNDIDTDNDGVVDLPAEIVGIVIDAVAIVDGGYPVTDFAYFGAPVVGPDGSTVPPGAARCPNGVDTGLAADWITLSADTAGFDGCLPITPGMPNPPECGGDGDGDGDLDLLDFAGFQECFDQSTPDCSAYELDGTCGITLEDLEEFVNRLNGP